MAPPILGRSRPMRPHDSCWYWAVLMVIVLAVLFLGEPFTWRVAVGGGLVLAGVLVLAWS